MPMKAAAARRHHYPCRSRLAASQAVRGSRARLPCRYDDRVRRALPYCRAAARARFAAIVSRFRRCAGRMMFALPSGPLDLHRGASMDHNRSPNAQPALGVARRAHGCRIKKRPRRAGVSSSTEQTWCPRSLTFRRLRIARSAQFPAVSGLHHGVRTTSPHRSALRASFAHFRHEFNLLKNKRNRQTGVPRQPPRRVRTQKTLLPPPPISHPRCPGPPRKALVDYLWVLECAHILRACLATAPPHDISAQLPVPTHRVRRRRSTVRRREPCASAPHAPRRAARSRREFPAGR